MKNPISDTEIQDFHAHQAIARAQGMTELVRRYARDWEMDQILDALKETARVFKRAKYQVDRFIP